MDTDSQHGQSLVEILIVLVALISVLHMAASLQSKYKSQTHKYRFHERSK